VFIEWRGRGIVIGLIVFGCLCLNELGTRRTFGERDYYQNHGWPKLVGFWAAAAFVYVLQPWLNAGKVRTQTDPISGKTRTTKEASFFFIPARHWPALLLVCGVLFYFVRR
jgi:hypothetical protein